MHVPDGNSSQVVLVYVLNHELSAVKSGFIPGKLIVKGYDVGKTIPFDPLAEFTIAPDNFPAILPVDV